MPRYLIEVSHENKKEACDSAVRVFNMTGSHFLTNADWGCLDNVHKAWIKVDLDNKKDALFVVPPSFRQNAKVITLQKFTSETVKEALKKHKT